MRMRNSPWVPPVQYTLRTETRVVEVGVVVRDSRSHSVGGLTRDDFEIEDGGKKREITAFSTETSSPPSRGKLRSSDPRGSAGSRYARQLSSSQEVSRAAV